MDLNIETSKRGDFSVITVQGEVDVFTAPKLREQLIGLVDQGEFRIVVDLDQVEFLDSTGLGVLVAGLKRVKTQNGVLAVTCSKEKILKIFRVTGLTKVFPIYDTVDEAISGAAASQG